ncbi:MAG: hypothetical protein JXB35_17205, partial [Anaerolineae bacterium]|nr:hypothetical protein [Anaerolineae bacterium]
GQVECAIEYHEQALAIAREIGDRQGEGNHTYNTACAHALLNHTAEACAWLEKAIALDAKYCQMARTDSDFDAIRDAPCFQALSNLQTLNPHLLPSVRL